MKTDFGCLELYRGRRCLVTGHTGFKGAWLSTWLESLGANVAGYALEPPTKPSLFELVGLATRVADIRGDVRDADGIAAAIERISPEIIFHLAAQPIVLRSYDEPKYTFDVNAGGTVNVLDAARRCPSVKAVVVVSSDKCYENRNWVHAYRETDRLGGHDPYSASKAAAEIVCHSYRQSFFEPGGVGLATARAGNVIGGGDWAQDRIIPDAVRAIQASLALLVRNPAFVRPWQHVLEPLGGYLMLGAKLFEDARRYSGAWNFAPGPLSCVAVSELIGLFFEQYGSGSWNSPSTPAAQPHEASLLALANDKALHGLGWAPRWNLHETVEKTAGWYSGLSSGISARELCTRDIRHYMEGR